MSSASNIPWEKIYEYVLLCGQEHDPYRFGCVALDEISSLISYDQGLLYCLDENRRVCNQHLVNIKSRWSSMYLGYYSRLEGNRHGLEDKANESFDIPFITHIAWDNEPQTEFIRDYIMARGVKRSLVFVLFDLNGLARAAFSLDRTRAAKFTERDMNVLRITVAQLSNLYKNFFVDPVHVPGMRSTHVVDTTLSSLTKREREVADLLCQGLSPAHVSSALHISVSTTYKHIAHIHKKLHVSSQQELLVRVLGSR